MHDLRVVVRPPFAFRLPALSGMDGLLRVREGVVRRLVCDPAGRPAVVRAAHAGADVLISARADQLETARWGVERLRFALGVDEDLRAFHERFRHDPLIGPALRADRGWRPPRRPAVFEAFAWAVCEQLIEFERAAAIQRRLVARWGHSHAGLRDAPPAAALARAAPAELQSCDLAAARAVALRRAAGHFAAGRATPRRLAGVPGIGSWTLAITALLGEGRADAVPAGDLHLRKLVGRARSGGDPRARAGQEEVLAFFDPYAPYGGLAALVTMRLGLTTARPPRAPAPAGTRWSARRRDPSRPG